MFPLLVVVASTLPPAPPLGPPPSPQPNCTTCRFPKHSWATIPASIHTSRTDTNEKGQRVRVLFSASCSEPSSSVLTGLQQRCMWLATCHSLTFALCMHDGGFSIVRTGHVFCQAMVSSGGSRGVLPSSSPVSCNLTSHHVRSQLARCASDHSPLPRLFQASGHKRMLMCSSAFPSSRSRNGKVR